MPSLPPSAHHGNGLDRGSLPSVCGYLCISLTALFLTCHAFIDPIAHRAWTREDAWIEDLTAISFLLASLLLFATAWMERDSVRRYVYVLGGLVMAFAVGEEISWGQRIFGFATPGFLLDVNFQHESNFHNTHFGKAIVRPLNLAQYLLCTVTLAAFFCRRDKLFGIPLPSIYLVLCLFIALSYKNLLDPYHVFSMFRTQSALLVLLVVFTLLTGRTTLFIAAASTLMFTQAHWYASSIAGIYENSHFEVDELLPSLVCLFYAVELFSVHERRVALPGTPFRWKKTSGGRIAPAGSPPMNARLSTVSWLSIVPRLPMVHVTCASIVAGSIGLVVLGHLNPEMTAAIVEKEYSRLKAARPIARAKFDIYLIESQLIYSKAPCAPSDIEESFFLHVIPTDMNVLSHRKRFGFDNIRNYLEVLLDATHPGGRCLAIARLPGYDIASIRTGQYTGNVQSWKETFRFTE